MNNDWQHFLQQQGATFVQGEIEHFGNLNHELATCQAGGEVITPLFNMDILEFSGADTVNFLNSQLTNDVKKLNSSQSQYSSYCTPQGRVLANFLLWEADPESCFALIPTELTTSIQQRLNKYILRAKVKIKSRSDDLICIGLAGKNADQLLIEIFGQTPKSPHQVIHCPDASLIQLANRFLIIVNPDKAIKIWQDLNQSSLAIGTQSWRWLEIQSGIPLITAATQDEFTPQMLNLDQTGAVSFDKGCYPGQEIVARTKYLGKLKRQLYLGHIMTEHFPVVGDRLYSNDMQDASGIIVNVAPSPNGGFDVLATVQITSIENGKIHWKSITGPILDIEKPIY